MLPATAPRSRRWAAAAAARNMAGSGGACACECARPRGRRRLAAAGPGGAGGRGGRGRGRARPAALPPSAGDRRGRSRGSFGGAGGRRGGRREENCHFPSLRGGRAARCAAVPSPMPVPSLPQRPPALSAVSVSARGVCSDPSSASGSSVLLGGVMWRDVSWKVSALNTRCTKRVPKPS